jgi:hypothetical protein
MMKQINRFILYLFAMMVVMTSCDDSLSGSLSTGQVDVVVTVPEEVEQGKIISERFDFKNVSNSRTYTFNSREGISLIIGLYDVDYEAEVELENGAISTAQAHLYSIQISQNGSNQVVLNAYNNIESDDLIISEVFFAGTLQTSGNQYYGDDYVKLYNNTDHVIYADGLTFFESKFTTTEKYDYSPDIMNEAMTVQALYTIPGSGNDYPVQPGEYLLLADTGIDHRISNPNSFDLSNADFEWYDVSSNPNSLDIDGPTVTNLDKWYCYTLTYFMLHNRGFKAYGIARIPIDRDTYLKDYYYTYDYEMITAAGTFPMSQSSYRLPNEWIVDVVNCSVESNYAWCVCAPQLDCGWTYCGKINSDKTRFFRSVRRKMLYLNEDGNPVLKDTNNSSADFNPECIPSEIEIQGTAIDFNGTPCTTLTYDGVTPIER